MMIDVYLRSQEQRPAFIPVRRCPEMKIELLAISNILLMVFSIIIALKK